MGIRGSKLENSPLVSLCKERKEFTKAAKSCRYELAAAYTLYTQSLVDVGNALYQYVEQEYLFDAVPEEKALNNDEKEANTDCQDSDDDSDFSSVLRHVHGDTEIHDDTDDFEVMESPISSSVDEKHDNLPAADGSRVDFMKVSKGKPLRLFEQEPAVMRSNQNKESSESAKLHANRVSADSSNRDIDEMVNAGTRIHFAPIMYDNYFDQMLQGVGSVNFPHSGSSYLNYGDGTALHSQMDMSYGYMNTDFQEHENTQAPPIAPPSPPQPRSSGWDILYPLSMNHDEFYSNYMQFGYERRPDVNDDNENVNRVRENEGIPDLEDDLEDPAAQAISKEEVKEGGTKSDEVGEASKCVKPSPEKDEVEGKSEWVKSSLEENEDDSDEDAELSDDGDKLNENTSDVLASKILEKEEVRKEAKGTEAEKEAIQETDVNIVSINGVPAVLVTSAISLPEAMTIIRDEFKTAFGHGKEVSVILEAGKLPFTPTNAKLKVLASQVLGSFIPSMVTNPRDRMLPYLSDSKRSGTSDSMNQDIQDFCRKFGDLSSSLEQLYMWEKKLYEEVVNEEKLRLLYEKEYKRMKHLDERGAEPDKINEILASTRKLHAEINVTVAAAEAIAKRIHMLRDDELFPQMKELIDGLTRMWRFMSTCHHRQLQAIVNTERHGYIVDPKIGKDSSPKATLRLEKTILDLGVCFSNFIGQQKAFVKNLNEWLIRCLYKEPQETEDGVVVPFSPNQLGAPVIFTICNDWHQAIEKISAIPVSKAIEDFSSSLRQLHQKQEEEHLERYKQKQLCKELETRIQSFLNLNSLSLNEDAPSGSVDSIDEKFVLVSGLDENLITLRERVDEQKAKHEQAIIQVNAFASTCLQEGLVTVFEALESFCSDSLRAYEQLTVPEVNIQ